MGLLDLVQGQSASAVQGPLGGSPKEGDAGSAPAAPGQAVGVVEEQGLGGLVRKLRGRGLGEAGSVWVGSGANLPVSGEQIQEALGSDVIRNLAMKVGIPPERAASLLSSFLPQAVDTMTPEGRLTEAEAAPAAPELESESTTPETEETEA